MEEPSFLCQFCGRTFTRQFNLDRHINRYHSEIETVETCLMCGRIFNNCDDLQQHIFSSHKPSKKFIPVESAFKKSFITYRYTFGDEAMDMINAQNLVKKKIYQTVLYEANLKNICKVGLVMIAQMAMLDSDEEVFTTASIPFRASNFLANASFKGNIIRNIKKAFFEQRQRLDDFVNSGSNWVFNKPIIFHIEIAPLKAVLSGHYEDDEETSDCEGTGIF